MAEIRSATAYRMVPDHICLFGTPPQAMVEERGFAMGGRGWISCERIAPFEGGPGIQAPPVVIDGQRIAGSEDRKRCLAA